MGSFTDKLGKLSLAILENFVESKLGKKFVDELRAPTDKTLAVAKALEYAKERFSKEFEDPVFAKEIFSDVSEKYFGLYVDVVGHFYDHPTDPGFPKILKRIIKDGFPAFDEDMISRGIDDYILILTEELALADETFQDNILAITELRSGQRVKHIEAFLQSHSKPEPDYPFDAKNYIETFIRQYENYDSYHSDPEMRRKDPPIFEHIFAADLQKIYVQLSARDKDGTPIPSLDSFVDIWLKDKKRGHLVLLGNYGSGKTVFGFQLIYRLLTAYIANPASNVLPIYMTFRQLEEGLRKNKDLQQTVVDILTYKPPNGYEIKGVNHENLYDILERLDILLILDGFDEIATSMSIEDIREHFSELKGLFRHAQKVIITCRENYLPSEEDFEEVFPEQSSIDKLRQFAESSFEAIRLSHFNEVQQKRYLELSLREEEKRFIVLRAIQGTIPGLSDLAGRPILLSMIVKYFENPPENLRRITAGLLYDEMVHRWLKDNITERHLRISIEEAMQVLEALAIELFDKQDELIDDSSLRNFLAANFGQILVAKMDFNQFQYWFDVCTFLASVGHERYGFIHRSFLEFFFAQALLREIGKGNGNQLGKARLFSVVADFLAEIVQKSIPQSQVIEAQLRAWVEHSHEETVPEYEYLGGNSAAILCRLGFSFSKIPNLSGIKLKQADLRGGNFCACNLSGANLDGTNLTRTDFSGSDLRKAKLDNIFMKETLFRGANLQGASLKNIRIIGGPSGIWNAAFSPDKHFIVIGTSIGEIVIVPYPKTDSQDAEFARINVSKSDILHFCFSADGEYLAIADRSGMIFIYSWRKIIMREEQEPRRLTGNDDYVRWLEFASDQPLLLSGGRDRCVKLWDLAEDPVRVKTYRYHKEPVMCVAWKRETHYVASCGYDFDAYLWSIDRDKVETELNPLLERGGEKNTHNHIVRAIAFTSNGQMMATAGEVGDGHDKGDFIKLWDVSDPSYPKFSQKLLIPDEVFNLAFVNEDKSLIAGSSIRGNLLLYDLESGVLLKMMHLHQDYIRSFSIHEKDNLLLTSSWDGTVKLWRLSDFSAHSTVFEIEDVNAATSYGVEDAFRGANITSLHNVSERWKKFFIKLGAIDRSLVADQ